MAVFNVIAFSSKFLSCNLVSVDILTFETVSFSVLVSLKLTFLQLFETFSVLFRSFTLSAMSRILFCCGSCFVPVLYMIITSIKLLNVSSAASYHSYFPLRCPCMSAAVFLLVFIVLVFAFNTLRVLVESFQPFLRIEFCSMLLLLIAFAQEAASVESSSCKRRKLAASVGDSHSDSTHKFVGFASQSNRWFVVCFSFLQSGHWSESSTRVRLRYARKWGEYPLRSCARILRVLRGSFSSSALISGAGELTTLLSSRVSM